MVKWLMDINGAIDCKSKEILKYFIHKSEENDCWRTNFKEIRFLGLRECVFKKTPQSNFHCNFHNTLYWQRDFVMSLATVTYCDSGRPIWRLSIDRLA